MEPRPHNEAMNLTVRPVTRLAGLLLARDSQGHGQGARPSRPAGYRWRYPDFRMLTPTTSRMTVKALLLTLVFCISGAACGAERLFPVQSAENATLIRVNNTREISDPAILRKVLSLVRQYNSWTVIPECRTGTCDDCNVAWIREGRTITTMALCNGGTRARAGGGAGIDSPCGRRVPEDAARQLTQLLGLQEKPK
jgi:hypothetical protein